MSLSGEVRTALARRRVSLGFVAGAAALVLARPTPQSMAAGGVVAAAGEALRIWAAGHLHKAREVTTSGPYRWFAHPLYAGSAVMGVGLAIACASVPVVLIVVAYLAATLSAAARSEEAFLRERFGGAYDRYRGGTHDQPSRAFSLRQAIANREHRAVIGLVAAFGLLALKAAYYR
jgi:protein-S-isoprenylcysteine O-methyltransferase Ste14